MLWNVNIGLKNLENFWKVLGKIVFTPFTMLPTFVCFDSNAIMMNKVQFDHL